jgi:nitrite reductase/ring-hydroxylating ferredoxin subunit
MSERTGDCAACGVNRREFLATSTLAVLGSFVVASCGDGQIGGVAGPILPPGGVGGLVVTLADFPALGSVGGTARVDGGGSNPVAVTRTGPSTFVALSMICPHAAYKPIQIAAPGFKCPNHGAEFESDGTWVGGQRTSDLTSFTVVYDAGAGTLTIT